MTRNHEIVPSLYARFVRLHAVEWHQLICMRVEFIGCKGTYNFSKPLNCGKGHVNTKNTKNRRTSSSDIKCGLTILPSVFFQCARHFKSIIWLTLSADRGCLVFMKYTNEEF